MRVVSATDGTAMTPAAGCATCEFWRSRMKAMAAPLMALLSVLLLPLDASPRRRVPHPLSADPDPAPYDVVFILTDDQRWDTVDRVVDGREVMPIVREELEAQGVEFTNAFVSTPLCCPDRASLLSGGYYAHNTGVLTNDAPNGGFEQFQDGDALPVRLREAGYKTGLVGKYLNRYGLAGTYVPPGWSYFAGVGASEDWYKYKVVFGRASLDGPGEGTIEDATQYIVDHLTDLAIHFIESAGDTPYFLYFSPPTPHEPATPAPGDGGLYPDFVYHERSAGEADLSDKPAWVRHLSTTFDPAHTTAFARNQLRSLRAVDRAVGAIIDTVRRRGTLDRTFFIFTSDNGYLWGEHRIGGKASAYEESIRVPLILRMPGVEPRREEKPVVTNVDIGATINELAGLNRVTDGLSLLPLLADPSAGWRTEFLIQNHGSLRWSGIRAELGGRTWKYVEHVTGEKELYDLTSDPFEMESRHKDRSPEARDAMETLAQRLAAIRGLDIVNRSAPDARIGKPYSFPVSTWGGRPPFRWSVTDGKLPAALTLDPVTGVISGTPHDAVESSFRVRVEDSSISPYTGRSQSFEQDYVLVVRGREETNGARRQPESLDTGSDQL